MSDGAPPRPAGRVLRGLLLLARFRREGFGEFAATPQGFLNSLAPLLAFPLVGSVLMLFSGAGGDALTDLVGTVILLLGPPVLSAGLARRWGREAQWLRYAVAYNWCQWAVPAAAILILIGAAFLTVFGLPQRASGTLALFAIAGYGISLHWFLARHGLMLSVGRATGFILLVNFGTAALLLVPRLLLAWMFGPDGG